jgi:hypothetical protein
LSRSFAIETLECIDDVVEAHWRVGCRLPELWCGLHGAGIGCPGGKDRPLLLHCHIRIVYDLHRSPECPGRMEESVEVKFLSL